MMTLIMMKVALDRAKEASAKERSLIRLREQVNINIIITITMVITIIMNFMVIITIIRIIIIMNIVTLMICRPALVILTTWISLSVCSSTWQASENHHYHHHHCRH